MKKIAIVGATGMLGQPVAKEFLKAGFEVTLFARNPEKAIGLFGPNVRIVQGDLADVNSIIQLLEGQDGLYLNLSVEQKSGKYDFQPERDGLDNIIKVVKNSSVKRIGYLSSLVHLYQGQNDFYWWAFEIKQSAVLKIKYCGLHHSIFYPSTFMECFDKGAYRQGDYIALAGKSNHKMHLISGSDYGKQVVKAFQLDNGNNEYVVQGPEGYTADDAAEFYVRNYTKKKVKIMKAPIGLMKLLGGFTNKFNYGANICEALNNYPEEFRASKTWNELGKPETKFSDYIHQSM